MNVGSSTVGRVEIARLDTGAANAGAPSPHSSSSLLPPPSPYSEDSIAALYQLFADSNREDSKAARTNIEASATIKRAQMRDREEALARAQKAAEDKGGFFDSMGLGSLLGIATANPMLVLADMSIHMAKLTPDVLHDFENENKSSIELATKLYCAAANASLLANGIQNPESLRAAVALGGLVLQESGVLGKEASDWAGAGMVVIGGQNSRAAAGVVIADKDSAVADEIRVLERETQEYTKWAAITGMVVAGVGACVGSFGTATFAVAAVGVALSTSGFLVSETECLDDVIGKDASIWIGSGMMLSGSILSGAGAAAAAGHVSRGLAHASRTLSVAGGLAEGAATTRQGLEMSRNAAIVHEVDQHQQVATKHAFETRRLEKLVEDLVDAVRDLKNTHVRVSQSINDAVDTQCRTQLIAAGMRG